MTDERDNTPDWIKKRNQDAADEKAREEAAEQRRQQAATSIQAGGPAFWQRFADRAAANANSLHKLDDEELTGSISHALPGGISREHNCYIRVARQSVRYGPEMAWMNLWYMPRGSRIRCYYLDQQMEDIQLVLRAGRVYAAFKGDAIGAEELADRIVQGMTERVKARKRRAS